MSGNIKTPPVNLSNINGTIWGAQSTRNSENNREYAVSLSSHPRPFPTSRPAVNITAMRVSLAALNASLWVANVTAPPTLVASMSALSPVVTSLAVQIGAALTALDTFSGTLRCYGTATACTVVGSPLSPCNSSNVCTPATRFCLSDGSTPCVQNSDCVHGGGCAYDGPTLTSATTTLTAYGASSGADSVAVSLAPVTSSLGSATTSLLAVPSISTFNGQLTSVQAALAAVPISDSLSAVTTLQAQLNPSSLDLGPTRSSISSAKSAFDSAASLLSDVRSQLVSFNDSLSSVKSQTHSLGNLAVQFCDGENAVPVLGCHFVFLHFAPHACLQQ